MKRKYVINPGIYALGENEMLYAKMAAKGWLLYKRGSHFSRFYKTEPQKLLYRAELSGSGLLDDNDELRDKIISAYEERGWTYVTGCGILNIFSASEGTEAPDVYSEPEQRRALKKTLRRTIFAVAISLVYLLFFKLLIKSAITDDISGVINMWKRAYFELTALFLAGVSIILLGIIEMLRNAYYAFRLYRRLKKEKYLEHVPRRGRTLFRIVNILVNTILIISCLAFIGLSGREIKASKIGMSAYANGPFLRLENLGWNGESPRETGSGRGNTVQTRSSLLLFHWDTHESVMVGDNRYWLQQDIYEMRSDKLALDFLPVLLETSFFSKREDFLPVEVEGLDFACKAGMEYIAVRGNYVCQITYQEPGDDADSEPRADVFAALAEMLKKYV